MSQEMASADVITAPVSVVKTLHRVLSGLLLMVWVVPLWSLVERLSTSSTLFVLFAGVYVLVGLGLGALSIALWRSYDTALRVLSLRQVRVGGLVAMWGGLAVYEIVLLKQPIDLALLMFVMACICSGILALAIPNPNWSQAATFLVLLVLLFRLVETALTPRATEMLDFYRLDRDTLDIAIIGNSHAYYAFDDTIIADVLGINSFTLTYAGVGSDSMVYAAKQIMQTQHPTVLVIEAYPLRLRTTQAADDLLESARIVHYGLEGPLFFEATYEFYPVCDYPMGLSSLLNYHSQWGTFSPTEVARNLGYAMLDALPRNLQGRLLSTRDASNEVIVGQQDIPSAQFDPPYDSTGIVTEEEGHDLQAIIDVSDAAGVAPLLIDTPTIWTTQITLPVESPTQRVADAHALPFYDFNVGSDRFSRVHFKDFGHMNQFGSAIVSLRLANILAQQFGFALDQNRYDQYRAVLVRDLIVTLCGDQLTYTLDMVDDSMHEAEFAWHVVANADRAVLADHPFGAQLGVTFTLPAEGTYTIQITVRHRDDPRISLTGILTERYDPQSTRVNPNE